MKSHKRNNVKLLAAVIGGSGVIAMGAMSVCPVSGHRSGTGGPGVSREVDNHDHRLDEHRDNAGDGGGHHDGSAGSEGPRIPAVRRIGARGAVTNRV